MKAESQSFEIVAISKTEKNAGIDNRNDNLTAKIKLHVVYRERTESILNSSDTFIK